MPAETTQCPLLKAPCIESKCQWWTKLIGKDPQSTKTYDDWNCAITFLPILMCEVAAKENQTGAAVESMRNEMVKASGQLQKSIALSQLLKLEEGKKNG